MVETHRINTFKTTRKMGWDIDNGRQCSTTLSNILSISRQTVNAPLLTHKTKQLIYNTYSLTSEIGTLVAME